jgi:peptidoglycan/LPS O-acetylase OafA/YrhL
MSGADVSVSEGPRGDPAASPFRPDVEGLRAVAVVLVLLFHARVPGFTGGYVGVDVFFVISGFLITGLLVRELSGTGRISFPRFYARRARRLLPAAAATLVATAVMSVMVLPPLRVPDVGVDIAAAAAYVSNIRFALQATDYLASSLPPSPVLHFWSLGVEEQFYLFWPALLTLVVGRAFVPRGAASGVRRVTITLTATVIVSLALSLWLTGVQEPWAFFSLPTRAWELALGGLVAMPIAMKLAQRAVVPLLGWTGLALVVASGLIFDELTPFPGFAALVPVVGAALVIFAGLPNTTARRTASRWPDPRSLLSLPPMRFLGRISYSLYLWHWPILILPAVAFGPFGLALRIALIGLTLAVATISYRVLEEPIRRGRFMGDRPRQTLAFAGAISLGVVLVGMGTVALAAPARPMGPPIGGTIDDAPLPVANSSPTASASATGGSPKPTVTLPPLGDAPVPADLVPELAAARDDLPVIYSDGCHLDAAEATPRSCVFGDTEAKTTVVLFGDSHAAQWFPALERISKKRGWRLISMTKSACASADVRVWSRQFGRPYAECDAWREAAFERIAAEHPALVVVSNARHYTLDIGGKPEYSTDHEDVWSAGLDRTLQRLSKGAGAVVLIGDTTRMTEDPPVCLSAHLDDATACATPYSTAMAGARLAADAFVADHTAAHLVDPTPWTCFTDPCPVVIGRFLVYRDQGHLTATYSRALASELEAVLPSIEP